MRHVIWILLLVLMFCLPGCKQKTARPAPGQVTGTCAVCGKQTTVFHMNPDDSTSPTVCSQVCGQAWAAKNSTPPPMRPTSPPPATSGR